MLYWLAEWLGFPGALNLIRYLSFRSGAAVATALILGLWIGPRFILMLRTRQGKGQPIRSEEHTSELQSLMRISYAVFCLKKQLNTNTSPPPHPSQLHHTPLP